MSQKGRCGAAIHIIPSSTHLLELVFHSLSFNSIHVQLLQQKLRAARRSDKVHVSGSYAPTVLRRHILYRVVAVLVVQEGKVLFEGGRSAAGPIADLVLAFLLLEDHPHHVLRGDVVVLPVGRAFAAAVVQLHRLVALKAETQFTHSQLQLPHGARLRPPGSFSPSGQLLIQPPALPSLPVQQSPDHMLKLALREALEHHGN